MQEETATKPYVLEVKHDSFSLRFYGATLQEAAQKAQKWAKGLTGYAKSAVPEKGKQS